MRQLELTERILQLRSVPVLRALDAKNLAALAASVRPRSFRAGEVLLRDDDAPRSFFIVGSGTVALSRGGRPIGRVRGPGGVGFLTFLAGSGGGITAVADTWTTGFEVPRAAMEEIFEDHFPVLLGSMRWVARRVLEEMQVATPPPYVAPTPAMDDLFGAPSLGIVERILLLRRSRGFAGANVNSLARLARKMEEVRVPAGSSLWRPADPSGDSLFIAQGRLRLVWADGARVQNVGPGYVLGGMESLVTAPRWNELVADEPVIALRGTREALIDVFEDDRALAATFLSLLATLLLAIWDRKAEAGELVFGSRQVPADVGSPLSR